jgi:hypothetical protein
MRGKVTVAMCDELIASVQALRRKLLAEQRRAAGQNRRGRPQGGQSSPVRILNIRKSP